MPAPPALDSPGRRNGVAGARGAIHLRRMDDTDKVAPAEPAETDLPVAKPAAKKPMPKEIGGPEGPEPTRYGDWQFKGRVTDF